jgi:hypothetical protein
MFFAHVARILSILLLVFGAFLVLTALAITFDWLGGPRDLAMAKYLPGSKTTGEAIDKGCLYIVVAVALGTLSELAFTLRNGPDSSACNISKRAIRRPLRAGLPEWAYS